jgi:hypothetical protein
MLDSFVQPLLADAEVISALVGLGILILSVIKQIIDANKKAQPPAPRPQPVVPKAAGAGGGPAAGGAQADPLRNQVEEFLRRAGQPPQAGEAKPAAPPERKAASEIEVLIDDMSHQRRPLAEPLRPLAPAANALPSSLPARQLGKVKSERPKSTPRSSRPRRTSVAEHVAENVARRSRNLAEQASNLGRRIIQEDAQFDEQLKAKFDHAVGTLGSSATTPAQEPTVADNSPAANIAAMLANPDGVRQAVLINEILRRPSERW